MSRRRDLGRRTANQDDGGNPELVRASLRTTTFQGPLPHPDALAKYEAIQAGLAERIVVMAENQQQHRMTLESKTVGHDIWRSNAGMVAAVVISLAAYALSGYIVALGHAWGIAPALANTVGLVGVFVYGTERRRSEREKRAKLQLGVRDDS